MTLRPAIVCLDRDPTDADARRLRPGARIAHIADDLKGVSGTVVGVVGPAELQHAIVAAVRGWDLVVRLDLSGEGRRLALEDLDRIGNLCDESALSGRPILDPIDERLLDELAVGATLREAAETVGVSQRTAARRLALLRDALGVATNAGLVAHWRV